MSGGSLNYFYIDLESHIGDFGDKELDDLVKDLVQLFQAREWYLSSDTGEGQWNETRDKFKKKWFTAIGRQDRIKKYLDEIKDETLKSFGMSSKYCKECKNWQPDKRENYQDYGNCPFHSCLMHRYESCEKFSE